MSKQEEAGWIRPLENSKLTVQVRYLAARRPFVEKVDSLQTLQAMKATVLKFFDLVEGSVDGGNKAYNFALDGIVQTDTSVTLGSLAAGKHELKLDLIEQFIQG